MRSEVTFCQSYSSGADVSTQSWAQHAWGSLGIPEDQKYSPTFHDDCPVSGLLKEQEMLIKFMNSCKIYHRKKAGALLLFFFLFFLPLLMSLLGKNILKLLNDGYPP